MPRKSRKCPPELAYRIEQVNLVPPRATEEEWVEFETAAKEIMQPLFESWLSIQSSQPDGSIGAEYIGRQHELQQRYLLEVQKSKAISKDFVGLARDLPVTLPKMIADWHIPWLRAQADELREAVRHLGINWKKFSVDGIRRHFALDDATGVLFEASPSALSIIVRDRLPIDRLRLCPVCEKIFWQTQRGTRRESQTCGVKRCIDTLGNWKRKRGVKKYGSL
jgi:hypothetical protein